MRLPIASWLQSECENAQYSSHCHHAGVLVILLLPSSLSKKIVQSPWCGRDSSKKFPLRLYHPSSFSLSTCWSSLPYILDRPGTECANHQNSSLWLAVRSRGSDIARFCQTVFHIRDVPEDVARDLSQTALHHVPYPWT